MFYSSKLSFSLLFCKSWYFHFKSAIFSFLPFSVILTSCSSSVFFPDVFSSFPPVIPPFSNLFLWSEDKGMFLESEIKKLQLTYIIHTSFLRLKQAFMRASSSIYKLPKTIELSFRIPIYCLAFHSPVDTWIYYFYYNMAAVQIPSCTNSTLT